MSEFGLTETHEAFRKVVRRFALRELVTGAKERAKMESMQPEIVKKLGSAGLLGIILPVEWGGQGGDLLSAGIATEEVAKVDFPTSLAIPLWSQVAMLTLKYGSDPVKKQWIPGLTAGDNIVSFLLTEPDCGSDAAALRTTAKRQGNYYIVNGEKTSVSFGKQSHVALLFAKTDPSARAKGVTAFLMPTNLPGITHSSYRDMGCKPWGRNSLALQDVQIPAENRVGKEGEGFYLAMGLLDFVRACVALMCLGAAQRSVDDTVEYAKQRIAFGRPIAKFQAVSFKIAEAATIIDAGRLLCYRALWLLDNGLRATKETAMAKWFCPLSAVKIIHDCLLIHGHVGYTEEYPLEQRLRDVIGLEIGDGPAEIMKGVIVRETLGREFLDY